MVCWNAVDRYENCTVNYRQGASARNRAHRSTLGGPEVCMVIKPTGAVEKVSNVDGKPSLTVGGTPGVDPSSISQVA